MGKNWRISQMLINLEQMAFDDNWKSCINDIMLITALVPKENRSCSWNIQKQNNREFMSSQQQKERV